MLGYFDFFICWIKFLWVQLFFKIQYFSLFPVNMDALSSYVNAVLEDTTVFISGNVQTSALALIIATSLFCSVLATVGQLLMDSQSSKLVSRTTKEKCSRSERQFSSPLKNSFEFNAQSWRWKQAYSFRKNAVSFFFFLLLWKCQHCFHFFSFWNAVQFNILISFFFITLFQLVPFPALMYMDLIILDSYLVSLLLLLIPDNTQGFLSACTFIELKLYVSWNILIKTAMMRIRVWIE